MRAVGRPHPNVSAPRNPICKKHDSAQDLFCGDRWSTRVLTRQRIAPGIKSTCHPQVPSAWLTQGRTRRQTCETRLMAEPPPAQLAAHQQDLRGIRSMPRCRIHSSKLPTLPGRNLNRARVSINVRMLRPQRPVKTLQAGRATQLRKTNCLGLSST